VAEEEKHIQTVIGIQHNKEDETQWLYTSWSINGVLERIAHCHQQNDLPVLIPIAVNREEDPYGLDKVFGSNTYVISTKPAGWRLFAFPYKDLVCVQEVHYHFAD
jgi:hypothetical protein